MIPNWNYVAFLLGWADQDVRICRRMRGVIASHALWPFSPRLDVQARRDLRRRAARACLYLALATAIVRGCSAYQQGGAR